MGKTQGDPSITSGKTATNVTAGPPSDVEPEGKQSRSHHDSGPDPVMVLDGEDTRVQLAGHAQDDKKVSGLLEGLQEATDDYLVRS